jgi:hypothetical protein
MSKTPQPENVTRYREDSPRVLFELYTAFPVPVQLRADVFYHDRAVGRIRDALRTCPIPGVQEAVSAEYDSSATMLASVDRAFRRWHERADELEKMAANVQSTFDKKGIELPPQTLEAIKTLLEGAASWRQQYQQLAEDAAKLKETLGVERSRQQEEGRFLHYTLEFLKEEAKLISETDGGFRLSSTGLHEIEERAKQLGVLDKLRRLDWTSVAALFGQIGQTAVQVALS